MKMKKFFSSIKFLETRPSAENKWKMSLNLKDKQNKAKTNLIKQYYHFVDEYNNEKNN